MAAKAGTVKKTADAVLDEAKLEAEWDRIVEEIPELIAPLALPDHVQYDIIGSIAALESLAEGAEASIEENTALMKRIAEFAPEFFVSRDEFEAWRVSVPLSKRTPTYVTLYLHYARALGESGE